MNNTKTFSTTSWTVETVTGAWIVGYRDRAKAHKRASHRKANRVIRTDVTRTYVHTDDPDATLSTEYSVRTYEPTEKLW